MRFTALLMTLYLASIPVPLFAQSAPETFVPLVKKLNHAVVNISTKQVIKVRQQSPFGDPLYG